MLNLTQKERLLLNDEKSHEELCIKKYQAYSQQAQDPELKNLFKELEQAEHQHLNTVNQILSGQVPQMGQGQATQTGTNQAHMNVETAKEWTSPSQKQPLGFIQSDIDLCQDMLSTEKYVSSTYNSTIFECQDTQVRNALNHIQKEEQQHGEKIFKYMKKKGAYNPNPTS